MKKINTDRPTRRFGPLTLADESTVAAGTFFPTLANGAAGVRQISPIHFEAAEDYGVGPFKVLTRVVIPGTLPLVLVAASLALDIALLFTIAIELVSAREGRGR